MPYKRGERKGKLTIAELRRAVRLHNKLTKVTIPRGASYEEIIKIINDNGYNVDHANQKLVPSGDTKKEVPVPPPRKRKPKSEVDKKFDKELKELLDIADKNIEKEKKKPVGNVKEAVAKIEGKEKAKPKPKPNFKLKSPRKIGEVAKPTKKSAGFDMKITFKTGNLENQVRQTAKGFLKSANKDNVKPFLAKVRRSLGVLNLNEKDRRELMEIAKSVIKMNRPKLASLVE